MDLMEIGRPIDDGSSRSCPVADSGICSVEPSGSVSYFDAFFFPLFFRSGLEFWFEYDLSFIP